MNILITGINGFVGSNFVNSWKKKYNLYGLDINQTAKDGVEKIFSWEDLKTLPKTDVIIHLAGKAHDTKNESLADEYFEVNTELTKKIFDYFLQSETKTFVFFSSVKAAADTVLGDELTEEITPVPVGPYGESKILAENYILEKSNQLNIENKSIYILRPAMIHGPGNKGNLNLLYNVVKKGIPWPLGAFENLRSFCSIDNIMYVVERLMSGDTDSGIYHVCDDTPMSTNQLIELIAENVDKKKRIWHFPKSIIFFLARLGDYLHLPLNRERLKKLTENYIVSNKKIKNALNISQMPITACEGMQKTLDSFK